MAFTEITILEVDYAHVKECSENEVIIPYILSNLPPGEWKNYFEKQAPASASVNCWQHRLLQTPKRQSGNKKARTLLECGRRLS